MAGLRLLPTPSPLCIFKCLYCSLYLTTSMSRRWIKFFSFSWHILAPWFLCNLMSLCIVPGNYSNNITVISAAWQQGVSQPREVWSWPLSWWERELQKEWLLCGFLSRQASFVFICVRAQVRWSGLYMKNPMGGIYSHFHETRGSTAKVIVAFYWIRSSTHWFCFLIQGWTSLELLLEEILFSPPFFY